MCVAVGEDGSDDEVICNVVCDVDEWWVFGAAGVVVVEFELGGVGPLKRGYADTMLMRLWWWLLLHEG